ncbi:MAG: TonB-dependent receptor [Thalassobius sp.]|nr:TonB-dependent receptor [Thalassovita sp.]
MKIYIFTLFILSFTTAFAQTDLEVNILNPYDGKPIADVEVLIENPQIGYTNSLTTNNFGKVIFRGLSLNGAYRIYTNENSEFLSSEAKDIQLKANAHRSITLVLPPQKEQTLDEVVITSTPATTINTVNAEVASEMSIKKVQELPVEGRDITRMLYRLPNVSQATGFFPEAPNVSINGANGLFNNYMIDGMDNNERFLGGQKFAIPIGFVKNVTVLTNNYSVEFGNTGNGVINITSKSVSNDFEGEVFFVTRPGEVIDAETPYTLRDLSGNEVKQGFQRYQAGFGLGGAITKDKTFYYLNYEHTTDLKDNILSSPVLGINEEVRGENTFDYLSAKLDHHWSKSFKSSLRANLGLVTLDRQAGGLSGGVTFPSAANGQDRNSILIANQNVLVGDNFVFESNVQYSRFRWNYADPLNPDSPDVTVLDPTGSTIAVLGNPGYIFDSHENTFQFQEKLNVYKGKHTFKFGAELISANHLLYGGGNPNGSYTVQLTQSELDAISSQNLGASLDVNDIPSTATVISYGVELRPASYGTRQNIFSFYAEDQFAASPKLNLTLGLRYDYDNLSKGGSATGDYNNLAPRFSFNYQLSSRSSIRGGYGLFYDKILYSVYSDALQQNNTGDDFKAEIQYFIDQGILPEDTDIERVTFDGNLTVGESNNAGLPFGYLEGPSAETYASQRNLFSNERRILNPNGYDNPYTHQFSLGYQYQIDEHKLFYVDVVYNKSKNLFRTRNLNAPSAWDAVAAGNTARWSSTADSTRTLPIYGNYAIIDGEQRSGVAKSVVITETEGTSEYIAASFNLQKERGDDNFAYRIIYTLSRLENDTEDINFRAMDANNFEAEWGPSINDRTHIINTIFNYYPFKNFTATVAMLLQSGQPINRVPDGSLYYIVDSNGNLIGGTTNDLNGDGSAFGDAYVGNSDRYPGESRNSDRLPWSNTFDLGIQYQIPLGVQNSKLELRADVFNLFNTVNLSGYSNNATQSNQIQTGSTASGVIVRKNAAPPRQIQFSARYLF